MPFITYSTMQVLKLLLLFGVQLVQCQNIIDYYEDLINEEIQRASAYTFPKDASDYRPDEETPTIFGIFDYVIIGAGSAGSVVASRLSENNNWNVLLLEAGGEESDFSEIPAMSSYAANLEYNWGFNSSKQNTCCLAMNGICPFPRGKSLGGTSAINVLQYSRGNKLDYEKWAGMGNSGWSYNDVLPFYIKSENSQIEGDEGYHGFGGYLNVERHIPTSKKVDIFLKANQEMGSSIVDFNGCWQLGASSNQFNTIKGRRQSSNKAFIFPVRFRSNLKILTNSYVTKILIDKATKTAYGVLFSYKKTYYIAKIKKEVILSAGVVGSPTILMHSGVGPKSHLQEMKIPIVKDLQVGYNMHDHLTFFSIYFTTTIVDPSYTPRESITQYINGTGPLTIATNPQALAYLQTSTTNTSIPDIEVVFIPSINTQTTSNIAEHGSIYGSADRFTKKVWKRSLDQNVDISQLVVVLLHPKTRGRVLLNSNNPFVYPIIDSKCLSDEENEDVENIYNGIEKVVRLLNTDAFKKINASLILDPRCSSYGFKSREYWMCMIRLSAMNAYHGGGTCQMGPDPSQGAVVNHNLKVYGVRNLRVADTSIVPITLSSHMSAPAMMIGERVADFIKKEQGFVN